MKTIAIYGSSIVQADHVHYEAAYQVGRALAAAGYTVMTGGYAGVMEAASKGAAEVGGHVIGVTTEVFTALRGDGAQPNPWVVDEIRHPSLRERLTHLVLEADGYICMPGGMGTLHELITVWELMRVGDIPTRPLLCYGDYWREMLEPIQRSPYARPQAWQMVHFVQTPDDVVTLLHQNISIEEKRP
ncbi:MAG: LOG family protein [Chloroflexota bacterium]